jgi:hypothetical protein
MTDFDMDELMGEDSVFEDDPVQELLATRQVFAQLQQEWQLIKAQYKLAKDLGNEERMKQLMESARLVSEAGGKIKATIQEMQGQL